MMRFLVNFVWKRALLSGLLGSLLATQLSADAAAAEMAHTGKTRLERVTNLDAVRHARPAKERATQPTQEAKGRRQVQPKIVGGKEALPGAWPFMAGLLDANTPANFEAHFCGGTLVHPYWVVTAAHCVFDTDPAEIDVLLGGHDLSNNAAGRRIRVAEIIVHPDYNDATLNADIAFLRLTEPVENYQPIEIVDAGDLLAVGVVATAIGWGDTTGDGDYLPRLREVDLPIASPDEVTASLDEDPGLTPTMLVAGWGVMGRDTGSGDSGGPLVVWNDATGEWMLAGITSFGFPDGDVPYGIYTSANVFRREVMSMYQPGYAAWEARFGVVGGRRDADGDGWSNFDEYAFGGNPLAGGDASALQVEALQDGNVQFRLRGRFNEADLDFGLFQAASLSGNWQDVSDAISGVSPMQSATDAVLEVAIPWSGEDGARFYRASAAPTRALLTVPRVLIVGQTATGALTAEDLRHPAFADRHIKVYRIEGLTTGSEWVITGRSAWFDVRLELIDESTGTVLAVADSDLAVGPSGTDERITVSGDSTRTFLLRVTSEDDGGLGSFRIGSFDAQRVYSTMPAIGGSQTVSGSLAITDSIDPQWLPGTYYLDEFFLDVTGNSFIKISLSSNAFDTFLEVADAETGAILYFNDDTGGGTDSELLMETIPGRTYILRVSSALEAETGSYILTTEPGQPLPVLNVPGSITASLVTTDREDPNFPGTYMDEYELAGISPGQNVTITMTSNAVDSYLYLIDASSLEILDENDDLSGSSSNARIRFQAEANRSYRIRATSYDAGETGSYTLSAN